MVVPFVGEQLGSQILEVWLINLVGYRLGSLRVSGVTDWSLVV